MWAPFGLYIISTFIFYYIYREILSSVSARVPDSSMSILKFQYHFYLYKIFWWPIHMVSKLGQWAWLRCEHPSKLILLLSKYSQLLRIHIPFSFGQLALLRCAHPSALILLYSAWMSYTLHKLISSNYGWDSSLRHKHPWLSMFFAAKLLGVNKGLFFLIGIALVDV